MTTNASNNPVSTFKRYAVTFEIELLQPAPEGWALWPALIREDLQELYNGNYLRVGAVTIREERQT